MLYPSTSRILQWIIPAPGAKPGFMKAELPGVTPRAVGKRLRLTRDAIGLSQQEFGRRAGIEKSAMNNIEHGRNFPTLMNIVGLSEAHDVPLDWICKGSTKGMRHELLEAIQALLAVRANDEPDPPQPPRRRLKVVA